MRENARYYNALVAGEKISTWNNLSPIRKATILALFAIFFRGLFSLSVFFQLMFLAADVPTVVSRFSMMI